MVELALPRELKALGERAVAEALARRAGAVESEHLLLAILESTTAPTARTLATAGLDYPTFQRALNAERVRSLGAAGIAPVSAAEVDAAPRTAKLGWGASTRDVLRRADKPAARDGRAGALESEIARAVLSAELGTVPRALALAGLDRAYLLRRLARA